MAAHVLSLTIFILFLISANGRSLQKSQNDVDLKVKAVSRADVSNYTTNYNDVLGLNALVQAYPLLQEYFSSDDPCVAPVWSWIECNSDTEPRVIALDLSNRLLFLELPDFSSMDALERIDVSINSLYGLIPSFLATFPLLQELNLADNLFIGEVPDSLACNNTLKLTLTGNQGLTVSDKCSKSSSVSQLPQTNSNSGGGSDVDINGYRAPSKTRRKKKNNLAAILGGTISAFLVFWAGVGGYAVHHQKAKTAAAVAEASAKQGPGDQTPNMEEPINGRPTYVSP